MAGKCARCAGNLTVKHHSTTKVPGMTTVLRWLDNGKARATDGCWTDPDGKCEHGHSSWALRLGMV